MGANGESFRLGQIRPTSGTLVVRVAVTVVPKLGAVRLISLNWEQAALSPTGWGVG